MNNCTNCGHAAVQHNPRCAICTVINDRNIISCHEYSIKPGGSEPGACSGYGGHKEWCTREAFSDEDAERHFNRKENVRAIEAYQVKMAEKEEERKMQLHERTQKVNVARSEITLDIMKMQEKYDLTNIEMLQTLQHAQDTLLKYMLRAERHPDNPNKKADEA